MVTDISLEKIVQPHLLTCPPETPLAEAARRMADAHCSSILVEEAGEIVGIWTERDALAVDVTDRETYRAPIERHMSSPVKRIELDTCIGEAAQRFQEEGVRHFLVVDREGAARGIVSQTDVVLQRGVEYYVSLRQVNSVYSRELMSVPGRTPLNEATRKMRADGHDAVVTLYEDGSRGILTERDVLRMIGAGAVLETVRDLASRPLITIDSEASLYQARQLFTANRIRHLGVTEGGELVGLITFADILENIEIDYVRQLRETLIEREHSLAESNQQLRLAAKAFEHTFEGVMVTDAGHVIESVNPAFTRITGYRAHEVVGKTPAVLSSGRHDAAFYREMREALAASDHWQGEIWNRRRTGELYVEWLNINAVKGDDGAVSHYVAVFSDITRRKQAEEKTRFLAYHDALTGLPNRALFNDRLAQAIAHARRRKEGLAVLFLDLDRFKEINDTLGHHAGDELLRLVAQRLVGCVRDTDTVARLGGDEFTLVLEEIKHAEDAEAVAREILAALAEPATLEGETVRTSASIGISLYPEHGKQHEVLLRHADAAMYAAKQAGRGTCRLFQAAMLASAAKA